MPELNYTFRPSLFARERTLVIDDGGIAIRDGDRPQRRVAWETINEVHIQSGTAGDEDLIRWQARLGVKGGVPIRIDSVNVQGTADFEDKASEFATVLAAIHVALMRRGSQVRFLYGMGSGLTLSWRIALVLCILAGLFGVVAAIYSAQWEATFGAAAFIGAGVSGLVMLRGRKGPHPYDPATFVLPGTGTDSQNALNKR